MKKTQKTGFTLIELLVVIVIIGILATISVATFGGYQARAKDATVLAEVSSTKTQIDLKYITEEAPMDTVCEDALVINMQTYVSERGGSAECVDDAKYYRFLTKLPSSPEALVLNTNTVYAAPLPPGLEISQEDGFCANSIGHSGIVDWNEVEELTAPACTATEEDMLEDLGLNGGGSADSYCTHDCNTNLCLLLDEGGSPTGSNLIVSETPGCTGGAPYCGFSCGATE